MDAEWSVAVVVTPGAVPLLSHPEAPAKQLVVVPVDQSGTVRLLPKLQEHLRIGPNVRPPSPGFDIERRKERADFAHLVTLDRSGAREAITANLLALLSSTAAGDYERVWLPLMGLEGGGLSRQESLSLILAAIDDSGAAQHEKQCFAIATAEDIKRDELIALREQVESAADRRSLDLGGALERERAFLWKPKPPRCSIWLPI
jgi:hypothetical protein